MASMIHDDDDDDGDDDEDDEDGTPMHHDFHCETTKSSLELLMAPQAFRQPASQPAS